MRDDHGRKQQSSLLLILVALLTVGDSWVYDTPGAIYTSLAAQFGSGYTSAANRVLYSVYNWPNVVLSVLSGVLIDKWLGLRQSTMLFAGLVLAGQLVFSLAVTFRSYSLAVIGRFVYGLGGEAVRVAQSTWIAKCSPPDRMSWTFGWVLGISRIASAVNFAATPSLAEISVLWATWFGSALCFISWLSFVLLVRKVVLPAQPEQLSSGGTCTDLQAQLAQVRSFPLQVKLQVAICVFYHVGVLLLYGIGSGILQAKAARFSERTPSLVAALPLFIAVVGTPAAGITVDRCGKALWLLALACVLLVVAHLLLISYVLGSGSVAAVVSSMTLVGASYSLATAVIWPLVPFLLPKEQLGVGNGIMTSVENLGLAVLPLVFSAVQAAPSIAGTSWLYTLPILLLVAAAVVAFALVLYQVVIDVKFHQGRLNKPASERTATDGRAQPIRV